MFRISRFHAVMNTLPRAAFERSVTAHGAGKHRKGFSCWDQLLVMIYAQMSGASSLRTLTAGFNAHASHHYHLGSDAVSRSTLADANARTPSAIFADTVRALMGTVHRGLRQEGAELLYLLDSTSITLKGPGFDAWTFESRTRNTQGLKLHVLYAAGKQAPTQIDFSAANVNDIDHGRALNLQSGVRYVFDKGYCDYAWWTSIGDAGSHFVTRFKRNAAVRIEQTQPYPAVGPGDVLCDERVRFSHRHTRAQHTHPYQAPLRRITVAREAGKTPLLLATNDLDSPAQAIAEQYKARWGIELFFKWIKQHLRLGSFLGKSENAVKIQILTALIAYLLVVLYRQTHALKDSLWACLALLRSSLFQRPAIEAHRHAAYQRQRHQALLLQQQQPLLV